jgi:hypothetical protein
MQSALFSRYWGGGDEPITARTNLYICLCTQEFDTSHLPDQVQDQVARQATSSQGARRIAGPLTEGPGHTSRPRSLPAPRVPVTARRRVLADSNSAVCESIILNL